MMPSDEEEIDAAQAHMDTIGANLAAMKREPWRVIRNLRLMSECERLLDMDRPTFERWRAERLHH